MILQFTSHHNNLAFVIFTNEAAHLRARRGKLTNSSHSKCPSFIPVLWALQYHTLQASMPLNKANWALCMSNTWNNVGGFAFHPWSSNMPSALPIVISNKSAGPISSCWSCLRPIPLSVDRCRQIQGGRVLSFWLLPKAPCFTHGPS